MEFPDLSGPRLNLVQLDRSALADLDEYSRLPEFFRYLEFGCHDSFAVSERYFEKLQQRSNGVTGHYWMIQLAETGKVIGTFGLLNIDTYHRSLELGYGLSPKFWGYGYFHEALAMVLDFVFARLDFHRVWVKTQADNEPSLKGLARAGFTREGTLRDFYLSQVDGAFHDAAMLSLLKAERA